MPRLGYTTKRLLAVGLVFLLFLLFGFLAWMVIEGLLGSEIEFLSSSNALFIVIGLGIGVLIILFVISRMLRKALDEEQKSGREET